MNPQSNRGIISKPMRRLPRGLGSWLLAGAIVGACGGTIGEPQTGGESHFLTLCNASCGDGLDCVSGVCTRGCLLEQDSCTDLDEHAVCTDQSIEPGQVAVCDVACEGDGDCSSLGSTHRCDGGYCRGQAIAGDPDGGASCRVLHLTYPSGSTGVPNPGSCDPCECDDGVLICPEDTCEVVPVFVCPDAANAPLTDPIDVSFAAIAGDELILEVGHGGGCEQHDYGVCYSQLWLESDPVQIGLSLLHDAHGDMCEAYLTEVLHFDLRPLAEAYNEAYQTDGGEIQTGYGLYRFGEFTCEEMESLATDQARAITEQAASDCTVDTDCNWTPNATSCTATCGGPVSSYRADLFTEGLEAVNAQVCTDFEAAGCAPSPSPPCIAPAELACVDGTCQEVLPAD